MRARSGAAGRRRPIVVVSLLALALVPVGAACAARGHDRAGSPPSATAQSGTGAPDAPAASAVPATTVPLVSFDGAVSPPPLIDTGTDYAAILRSLDGYRKWLDAHRPDPALAERVFRAGTRAHAALVREYTEFARDGVRLVDPDARLDGIEVVSILDDTVSLTFTDVQGTIRIVGRDGRVVEERPQRPRTERIAILAADHSGHWRIAVWDERVVDPVVLL